MKANSNINFPEGFIWSDSTSAYQLFMKPHLANAACVA